MIQLSVAVMMIPFYGISAFIVPGGIESSSHFMSTRTPTTLGSKKTKTRPSMTQTMHAWSPQDLTKDTPGFLPIPIGDYVKKYQANPELWPVEFFVLPYRRVRSNNSNEKKTETQILVRKSANGTSKWGLGTGVPATRWMLSSSSAQPPFGYQWTIPKTTMGASDFPEFSKHQEQGMESWSYRKIDICQDAFNGPDAVESELVEPRLEEYANQIRNELKIELEMLQETEYGKEKDHRDSWESTRLTVIKNVVDNANSLAAIQGTFRMSGLFTPLGEHVPDPADVAFSMRIFTMWPQMPDPMPLPSTPPEELQSEIIKRDQRMLETGRDPHKDKYGRTYTHKSTSNVSNTIHGVYFTLDLTDLPGLDEVPAFDLFGTKEIQREWKSLEDLKVLDASGKSISTEDTKPTFISGFIARQLVKEGVIKI